MCARVLAGLAWLGVMAGLTGCGAASAKYPDGVTVTEIKHRLERAPGKGQFVPSAFPTETDAPATAEK